jgi:hypothetical protein
MKCPLCQGRGHYKFKISEEGQTVLRCAFNPDKPAKWMISPGRCGLCEGRGIIYQSNHDLADPFAARGIPGGIVPGPHCSPTEPGSIARANDVFAALIDMIRRATDAARAGMTPIPGPYCPKCGSTLKALIGGVRCSKCGFQKAHRTEGDR